MKNVFPASLIILLLAWIPTNAYAHLVSTRFGEFYSGMLHPTTTLIHALPWITLGFLAAFQPLKQARAMMLLFPLSVVLGALLGSYTGFVDAVDSINLASIVILGACVVRAKALPTNLLLILTVLFGFTHGHANANLDLGGNEHLLYLGGIMLAAYLAFCLTSAGGIAITNHYTWGRTAIRAGGSWVLAIGIIFAGFTFLNVTL
jgi:hydrogenase/urease accessory protein HupE